MKSSIGALLLGRLLLSSTAQATLLSRLGGAAAYDDVLDITWLTDANANPDVIETWDEQVAWAESLNVLGFDDWRLASMSTTSPTTTVFDCAGSSATDCADAGNELAYMYYHNMDGLGNNTGIQIVDGISLTDVRPFYWSGTEFDSDFAWPFAFNNGAQFFNDNGIRLSGWAVRSGDVLGAPVPEPATLLLMAAGLGVLGLSQSQRRR